MAGSVVAPQILVKHPNESIQFLMDFVNVLAEGEYLTNIVSVEADSDNLTLGTPALTMASGSVTNNAVVVQISDGLEDEEYKITFEVLSSEGQTYVRVGVLVMQA